MAHDVFISHARKDNGMAAALCEKLESASVRCWIADRDISAGEDWTEVTRNAIGSSRLMILVLSENANAAAHIEREIAHAFYTGRIIIPLRVTDTLPRRDFLFYLGNVRCFDAFTPPAEQHLEVFTETISGMVHGFAPAGDPVPPPRATAGRETIQFSDSWIGALQASHYGTLEILKCAAIAGFLIVVAWLLWFEFRQIKHQELPGEINQRSMSSGPIAFADSSHQASGEASMSKPAYSFTRFGLWVPPNTSPTPAQQGPQETSSNTQVAQSGEATASPLPDTDNQHQAAEAEGPQTPERASAQSVPGDSMRKIDRRTGPRNMSRTRIRHGKVHGSGESRIASKYRLRAHWRRFAARIKEYALPR